MANDYTGTAADWAANRASYKKSLEEARPFEEYFLGSSYGRKAAEATAEYAETSQAEAQQAQYDITSAFKNYKQSQMNIFQNRNLATGFKKQVSEDLASSFAGTRGAIESNLAPSLRKQYRDYLSTMERYQQKAQSEYEKEIAANVDYLTNVQEAWYTKAGLDTSMLEISTDKEGGLGFYESVEDKPGTYRMTDAARRSAYETVYGPSAVGAEDFGNYLREQYGDETADWFYANRDIANEMVFGLDPEVTGTEEEREKYYIESSIKELNKDGLYERMLNSGDTIATIKGDEKLKAMQTYSDIANEVIFTYNAYRLIKGDVKTPSGQKYISLGKIQEYMDAYLEKNKDVKLTHNDYIALRDYISSRLRAIDKDYNNLSEYLAKEYSNMY